MLMRIAGAAVVVVSLALLSCRGADSHDEIVVVIDGRNHTVADLEQYLRVNLPPDQGESLPRDDRDRVLSRLFDNFVEERLLLAEAGRQGISVTDEELARAGASDRQPAVTVRERVRVQKFLDAYARQHAEVSDDAVAEYLREHHDRLAQGREIVLRSVALASRAEAGTIERESLEEAAIPVRIAERDLPPTVREALAGLKPGELSGPLEIDGVHYLFQLVERLPAGEGAEDELERRARDELLRARRREAIERLLDELDRRYRPEIRYANLPFRYRGAG